MHARFALHPAYPEQMVPTSSVLLLTAWAMSAVVSTICCPLLSELDTNEDPMLMPAQVSILATPIVPPTIYLGGVTMQMTYLSGDHQMYVELYPDVLCWPVPLCSRQSAPFDWSQLSWHSTL